MSDSRSVGNILVDLGRLTRAEVDQALDFQKRNGGYFGEALIALHLVSRQELDWALATQFDIPYIVPSPDEVDPAAASLVTSEWALAHTALPILSTDAGITVVVAEPNREAGALEQLGIRTGRKLNLALASPATIRALIRTVFTRLSEEKRTDTAPTSVVELWDLAVRDDAPGIGISVRGPAAWGWFRGSERIERRLLDARWEHDLRRLLDPDPREMMNGNELGEWRAELEWHGLRSQVDVSYLRSRGGTELFLRPVAGRATEHLAPPDPGIAAEIAALVQPGGARFHVACNPPSLCAAVVPRIPALALGEAVRSIHLTDRDVAIPGDVVSLRLSADASQRDAQLERIRTFEFDVVTTELADPATADLTGIAELAPTLFAAVPRADPAGTETFAWQLHIDGNEQGRLDWRLEPFQR